MCVCVCELLTFIRELTHSYRDDLQVGNHPRLDSMQVRQGIQQYCPCCGANQRFYQL